MMSYELRVQNGCLDRTGIRIWLFLVIFMGVGCAGLTELTQLGTSPLPTPASISSVPPLSPTTSPLPSPTLAPSLTVLFTTPVPLFTQTAIPTPTPQSSLTSTPALHIVVEGETLSSIANDYQLSVEAIVFVNNLLNADQLAIGQTLIIQTDATTPLPTLAPVYRQTVIGYSVEDRPLNLYSFGTGQTQIVFVGGIHGGYEWNSILLAYQALDYLNANPTLVPENLTVHLIPNANPDGLFRVTGREGWFSAFDVATDSFVGRFNGRNVDLNRNWGCNWSAEAFWRDVRVDAGTEPFSEPETQALRDFFLQPGIEAVIFWHSAAGLSIPGRCTVEHPASIALANTYGQAAGYALNYFTAYEVTGDASDWLVEQGIPSISIELTTHDRIEWDKNSAGILAILTYYTAR